ncbi:unnamed protein product [Brassica oleracea]
MSCCYNHSFHYILYICVYSGWSFYRQSHSLIKQVPSSLLLTIIAQVLFNHKTISILLTKSSNKFLHFYFLCFYFKINI